jgi:diguanylate cyclase (GGDEF)-like protein
MARRTFQLILLLILAFALASYLIFSAIMQSIERNDRESQLQLLTDTRNQLELSYQLLNRLLAIRQERFREIHRQALSLLTEAGGEPDLESIKQILTQKAGYPVDLFLIGSDLTIQETTYPPDLGLDLNQPPFIDAQYFLRQAKEGHRVMVGQPTMEFISKRVKIYTYSELGGNRYLELGFIDPEIDGYFQTLIRSLKQRSDVQVQLFFELWDTLLAPLGQKPLKEPENKNLLLEQHQLNTGEEHEIFRKVIVSNHPYKTESTNRQGEPLTIYYIQLSGLSPEMLGNLEMRFLARVTFNGEKIAKIKQQFLLFFWVALLLTTVGLISLAYMIRICFIHPLKQIVGAIKKKEPVTLQQLPKQSAEFREIGETYNQTLAHLRENMQEVEKLSQIDPLTGLHNRRYFYSVFAQEVARAARSREVLALAMFDIDHFKCYNDHYGHQRGDRLLTLLADHLKDRFMRPSDHVCRMGGDEFSTLLTDIDPQAAGHVFQEVKQAWLSLLEAEGIGEKDGTSMGVSISIGVYLFATSGDTSWKESYRHADEALYEAKKKGRNRVVIRQSDGAAES